jgi:ketopantoate reductase
MLSYRIFGDKNEIIGLQKQNDQLSISCLGVPIKKSWYHDLSWGEKMKILVVGAGSVGQVYGYHLGLGGAEITFYVKEKYAKDLKNGLRLLPLNKGSQPKSLEWNNFQVISSDIDVSQVNWDYVLLTLPSNILYTDWLPKFAKVCPKNSSIITLQPNIQDKFELEKYFPKSQIILGVITLIAFNSPQKSEVAFWFPPLAKAPFDGDVAKVNNLLSIFSKSGFPATFKKIGENPTQIAFGANFLNIFVFVLENQKWKLDEFKTKKRADILTKAIDESFEIIASKLGLPKPKWTKILNRFTYSFLINLAKFLMPFDLEKYLEVHFTKVSPQMKRNVDELVKIANEKNIHYPTIRGLLESKLTL